MKNTPEVSEEYSQIETERRREDALKRMLLTPPKPHTPLGKKKTTSANSSGKKNKKRTPSA